MLSLLRIWIIAGATLAAGGWILSAAGLLNKTGYVVLGLVMAAALVFTPGRPKVGFSRGKWRRRFSRPAPLLFLILAVAAAIGGFLYPPVNVDGYSYRIPRVLHWLWAGKWHWIHSADVRLNVVAPGFDWLSAPLLLFCGPRAIPVVNVVSFLLLPGAIFMVLHRLGVRPRVAWWWMWILPAGFCYCMQAGSIANDMYAAVYTLAAMGFALRASESRRVLDLWVSLLALALASGAKQTNIPFALPWLIASWPALPLLKGRLFTSAGILAVAILASIIPISFLNIANGFPWQGFAAGRDYAPPNAFWGIVGNAFWVAFSNLQPPVIPWADSWNAVRNDFLASDAGRPFRSFEVFAYLHRAASEQYAGLGCTVLLLLLASWITARLTGRRTQPVWDRMKWIRLTVWLGFFVFLAKVGINQCPRYLAPWYPFLAASFLLAPGASCLVRARGWRLGALAVLVLSVALIVLSRQRPLFPAETLARLLEAKFGHKPFLKKVVNSYTFANALRYELEPFVAKIPRDEKVIGYAVKMGDKEPWLWEPLFTRRVVRVLNSDPPERLRQLGIRYVVVDRSALSPEHDRAIVVELDSPRASIHNLADWLKAYDAEVVAESEIRVEPDAPPDRIYLVRLR